MFFLSKLSTFVILPPGLFFLAFLVATLLLFFGKRRAGAIVACATLVLFYALSSPAFSELLIRPLEDRYPPYTISSVGTGEPKNALVAVLAAGNVDHSPEEAMRSSLGGESLKRLVYGLRIAKTLSLPLVFTGGRPYPKKAWRSSRPPLAALSRKAGSRGKAISMPRAAPRGKARRTSPVCTIPLPSFSSPRPITCCVA